MITTFYIDRPLVANALDLATARLLKKALNAAVKAKNKGLIIASASNSVFCSGGDLKAYKAMKSKKEGVKANKEIRLILKALKASSLVVVAAVEGDAVGGGVELALACDFIVASASSRFSFRQVKLGLTPGWGGAKNLLYRVPGNLALRWLASGDWISAQEGLRTGLLDEVTTEGHTLERAQTLIGEMHSELFGTIKKLILSNGDNEGKIFDHLWQSRN